MGEGPSDLVDLGCCMCRQSAARAPPRLSDELKKELPGINLPVACQCGRVGGSFVRGAMAMGKI